MPREPKRVRLREVELLTIKGEPAGFFKNGSTTTVHTIVPDGNGFYNFQLKNQTGQPISNEAVRTIIGRIKVRKNSGKDGDNYVIVGKIAFGNLVLKKTRGLATVNGKKVPIFSISKIYKPLLQVFKINKNNIPSGSKTVAILQREELTSDFKPNGVKKITAELSNKTSLDLNSRECNKAIRVGFVEKGGKIIVSRIRVSRRGNYYVDFVEGNSI